MACIESMASMDSGMGTLLLSQHTNTSDTDSCLRIMGTTNLSLANRNEDES